VTDPYQKTLKGIHHRIRWLAILQYGCIAILMTTLWVKLSPNLAEDFFYIAPCLWALLCALRDKSVETQVQESHLTVLADMQNPAESGNPYAGGDEKWLEHVAKLKTETYLIHGNRLRIQIKSLALYVTLAALALLFNPPSLQTILKDVEFVVSNLQRGAVLKIIDGAALEEQERELQLSARQTTALTLLSENMIEITARVPSQNSPPVIELFTPEVEGAAEQKPSEPLQRFQMLQTAEDQGLTIYTLRFSLAQSADLYLDGLFGSHRVATVKVERLPIPQVVMSIRDKVKDPWPDNLPLPLIIEAQAQNPLRSIQLIISSGKRQSRELVSNIMAEDKQEIKVDYELLLETYNDQDVMEIQIVAEVVDRSLPKPLVGLSEPIFLNIASSYGRYRQTLATLKELKSEIDRKVENAEYKLPEEVNEIGAKALEQSMDSPFFDGIDRMQIGEFVEQSQALTNTASFDQMAELSTALNFFLFEHEILDDRERDRDFFVAARSLSRLMEDQTQPQRVIQAAERMEEFLSERHFRWNLRLEHLAKEYWPPQSSKIMQDKPFHALTSRIKSRYQEPSREHKDLSLKELSESVAQYKNWIESLEQSEDKSREQDAAKRQEGLAASQEALKELQRRQAKISSTLDRADQQEGEQLKEEWGMARMEQSANIDATQKVEGQMRSLSPLAARRIKAALEEMENTRDQGNKGQFVPAETASDQAGRLLNQAQNAAEQQAQSQQNSQGRRRRRVTGDNYYGQGIVTGDIEIKRTYQVDRRYREDVLKDVNSSARNQEEENREYLRQYLRKVVR
jgi:hypothetical protein